MDQLKRRLIDEWQGGFPLCERPFAVVAERLEVGEDAVLDALRELLADGVLTRFGPLYQIERLGGAFRWRPCLRRTRISSGSPVSSTVSRKWPITTGAITLSICGLCWPPKRPQESTIRLSASQRRPGCRSSIFPRNASIFLRRGSRWARAQCAALLRFLLTPNPAQGAGHFDPGAQAADSCHPGRFAACSAALSRDRRATEE